MHSAEFSEHFTTRFAHLIGRRVLVALSGGADSVALLHLLRLPDLELNLEAAHVHHGIRGAEADGDASFCVGLCGDLGIPCHMVRIDPSPAMESGREATWRRLRYGALIDIADNHALEAVATGHHRDDVAEGFLVQLLRGGGPRALAGISETTGRVIRPLLSWSKGDLVGWLREEGFQWREDSSNRDPQHLRNRVRHELLPALEEASPALRTHLVHLAGALARDESFFSEQLRTAGSWIDPWEPEGGVEVSLVADLPPPLRSRWLHAQAARIGLPRVTRRQADLFGNLLDDASVRAVTLGQRWCIRKAGGRLWLAPPATPREYRIELVEETLFDLPLPGWTIRLARSATADPNARWSFAVNSTAGLLVRSPRSGDEVEVHGRPVGVGEILARKLPRHLRKSWPVCCESDRIQWIPGLWQGPGPSTGTSHVVEVTRRERPSCPI